MADKDAQRRFGNWFIPLLIGAAAFFVIFWAYSEAPTHRHYNPAKANGTDQAYEESASISKLPPNVDTKSKATKKHTEKDKEAFVASRSDLAAQWAMAHYTFVGLWVGIIGICFLIWTIIETKGASYFAEQALDETKFNSKRELRAYISVVPFAINKWDASCPTVIFRFFNKGQTPAIGLKCQFHFTGILDGEEHGSFISIFNVKITIPPNSHEDIEWPMESFEYKDNWSADITANTSYSDIFGAKRFIDIECSVDNSMFPKTKAIGHTKSSVPFDAGHGKTGRTSEMIPWQNPKHIPERRIKFLVVRHDLQKEAKEYAKANKPT